MVAANVNNANTAATVGADEQQESPKPQQEVRQTLEKSIPTKTERRHVVQSFSSSTIVGHGKPVVREVRHEYKDSNGKAVSKHVRQLGKQKFTQEWTREKKGAPKRARQSVEHTDAEKFEDAWKEKLLAGSAAATPTTTTEALEGDEKKRKEEEGTPATSPTAAQPAESLTVPSAEGSSAASETATANPKSSGPTPTILSTSSLFDGEDLGGPVELLETLTDEASETTETQQDAQETQEAEKLGSASAATELEDFGTVVFGIPKAASAFFDFDDFAPRVLSRSPTLRGFGSFVGLPRRRRRGYRRDAAFGAPFHGYPTVYSSHPVNWFSSSSSLFGW